MSTLAWSGQKIGSGVNTVDRQRLSKAVTRIVIERCGVMLISSDGQLLAHHAQILADMLRRDSGLKVSTIEVSDDLSLLERFNRLLSHLSVDRARGPAVPSEGGHVWIMSVQSEERFAAAKSLARMVHDFPGSNLSLVLLIEPDWAQAMARTRPGREMMRCTFKAPSSEFDRVDMAHASPPARDMTGYEDSRETAPEVRGLSAGGLDLPLPAMDSRRAGRKFGRLSFTLWLLIGSAALVGLLSYVPLAQLEFVSLFTEKTPASKPAVVTGESALSIPDPAVPEPVASGLAVVTKPPGPVVPAIAEMASAVPLKADAPPGDMPGRLEATQTWLATAPAGTHTIQLVGSNDEKQIETYLLRLRSLVDAEGIRVFRTKAGGRDSLTVIWGSFADARDAAVARDKLPAELRSAKPIVRTVAGINAELKR